MVNSVNHSSGPGDVLLLEVMRNAVMNYCRANVEKAIEKTFDASTTDKIMVFLMRRLLQEKTPQTENLIVFYDVLHQHAQQCACSYVDVDKLRREHDLIGDKEIRVKKELGFLKMFLDSMVKVADAEESTESLNQPANDSDDEDVPESVILTNVCKNLKVYCDKYKKSTEPPINYDGDKLKEIDDFIVTRGKFYEANKEHWLTHFFQQFFYHSEICKCTYKAMGDLMSFHDFSNSEGERVVMDKQLFASIMGTTSDARPVSTPRQPNEENAVIDREIKMNQAIKYYCSQQDDIRNPEFCESVDEFECHSFFNVRSMQHDIEGHKELSDLFDAFEDHALICLCPAKAMNTLKGFYGDNEDEHKKTDIDRAFYDSIMTFEKNAKQMKKSVKTPVKTIAVNEKEKKVRAAILDYCMTKEAKPIDEMAKAKVKKLFMDRDNQYRNSPHKDLHLFFKILSEHAQFCNCPYEKMTDLITFHEFASSAGEKQEMDRQMWTSIMSCSKPIEKSKTPIQSLKQGDNKSDTTDVMSAVGDGKWNCLRDLFMENIKLYCEGIADKGIPESCKRIDDEDIDQFFSDRRKLYKSRSDDDMATFYQAIQEHFKNCKCAYVHVCKTIELHKIAADDNARLDLDEKFYGRIMDDPEDFDKSGRTSPPPKKLKQEDIAKESVKTEKSEKTEKAEKVDKDEKDAKDAKVNNTKKADPNDKKSNKKLDYKDMIMNNNDKLDLKTSKLENALDHYLETQKYLRNNRGSYRDEKNTGPIQKFLIEKHNENLKCPRDWTSDDTFEFFTERVMHHREAAKKRSSLRSRDEERSQLDRYESECVANFFEILSMTSSEILDADAFCLKEMFEYPEEFPQVELRYMELFSGKKN